MEDKSLERVYDAIREVRNFGEGYGTVFIEIRARKIYEVNKTFSERITVDKEMTRTVSNSDGLDNRNSI